MHQHHKHKAGVLQRIKHAVFGEDDDTYTTHAADQQWYTRDYTPFGCDFGLDDDLSGLGFPTNVEFGPVSGTTDFGSQGVESSAYDVTSLLGDVTFGVDFGTEFGTEFGIDAVSAAVIGAGVLAGGAAAAHHLLSCHQILTQRRMMHDSAPRKPAGNSNSVANAPMLGGGSMLGAFEYEAQNDPNAIGKPL